MVTSSVAIETRHKVLLVDDDAISLEITALLLAHEGHEVLRAQNAGAALELLGQHTPPDVLLVDLHMPGVSGDQLAAKVRAAGNTAHRPLLLAMSATQAKEQQLVAFDGFLLKPLGVNDLRQAINPPKQPSRAALRVVHARRKPAPAPSQEGALDQAVIAKLLTLMPEAALHQVIAACLADTRASIGKLEQQLHAGDATLMRETAHRIKGAAQMIGATRIATLAAALETGGNKPAATRAVLKDLLSACIELEGMLLAGKFTHTRAPHHEPSNRDTGNT